MNERNNLFSATGIPSLFLIFGVLMLVILSLLGYGTSRQDQSASTLSLEQTTAYYDACTQFTDFYTDMAQELKSLTAKANTEKEFYQLVQDYFSQKENMQWNSTAHTAQYLKSFSETQSLMVEISILWTGSMISSDNTRSNTAKNAESSNYSTEILTWNTVVTADWTPDNSQSVYKGE